LPFPRHAAHLAAGMPSRSATSLVQAEPGGIHGSPRYSA
jgi:hypothetical protein